MSTTITEFLTARLDEDASVARDMQHQAGAGRPMVELHGGGTGIRRLTDPDHILADVAAKRAIVEIHRPGRAHTAPASAWWQECKVCFDPDTAAGDYDFETWPCPTLRNLARPYADHPDYDPAWRIS